MNLVQTALKRLLKNKVFIQFLLDETGNKASEIDPKILSFGICDVVSYYIGKTVPGAIMMRVDGTRTAGSEFEIEEHSFIKYKNKFYDYVTPDGVDFPSDLNFFAEENYDEKTNKYINSMVYSETSYLCRIYDPVYKNTLERVKRNLGSK